MGGSFVTDAGGAELSRADISLKDISINSGQQESLPYLIQASSLFKWDIYWKTLQHCSQAAECRDTVLRGREKMEMGKKAELSQNVVSGDQEEAKGKEQNPLYQLYFPPEIPINMISECVQNK